MEYLFGISEQEEAYIEIQKPHMHFIYAAEKIMFDPEKHAH
jgi:hypothetical protein